MSETLGNRERSKMSEKHRVSDVEQQQEKLNQTIESGPRAKNITKESIDEIRNSIDNEAKRQLESKKADNEKRTDHDVETPSFVNKNMKKTAYKKELIKIQHNLKKPQKAFSRFIHIDNIERASDIGAKTVARSSGILGGGIIALLGSSIYLWMSKNYGFSYNYFVFIILFILGFLLGIVVELIIKPFLKKH
jgi:hypothetical protein